MSSLIDRDMVRELAMIEVAPGESFLPQFLAGFALDAESTLQGMRDKARRADIEGVTVDAHRLKGGSASIGALRLAQMLEKIEQLARTTAPLAIEPMILEALTLLHASCDAILHLCREEFAALGGKGKSLFRKPGHRRTIGSEE